MVRMRSTDRKRYLPDGGLVHGDAHVHDERRAEGEEGEGLRDEAVGVGDERAG